MGLVLYQGCCVQGLGKDPTGPYEGFYAFIFEAEALVP